MTDMTKSTMPTMYNDVEDDNASFASTYTNEGGARQVKTKQQYNRNKLGYRNLFSCDSDTFRDAVKNRIAKVKEEDELYSTISASVNFFNEKMNKKMVLLKQRREDRERRIARSEQAHEEEARSSRLMYMSS